MKVLGNLTPHFSLEEIACNDKERTLVISPELVRQTQMLEEFRVWFNRPMKINSFYRTLQYNKAVGGVSDSQHPLGTATDIALPEEFFSYDRKRKEEFWNNIENKWDELCKKYGVQGGFGRYNSFFHVDSRAGKGAMATWDYRK